MSALDEIVSERIAVDKNRECGCANCMKIKSAGKDAAEELATLRARVAEVETLLKQAKDLFDGERCLCDDVESPEWIWKWRVRHYFHDTDIPVHL